MASPFPECWHYRGRWRRYLLQNVGEGIIYFAHVDDEDTFSGMLEVSLLLLMLMAKLPSLGRWRRYVDVDVADVDDEGTFSTMLEKVRWCR